VGIFNLNNRGFTLIEIAVTIAVVGIVSVAISGFFLNSMRVIDATDEREKALMIAQSKMEEIKKDGFKSISEDYTFNDGNAEASFSPTVDGYSGYLIFEEINDTLYKIEVIILWDNNSKNLEIVSYISER
jgi:prepilin-type N-terminal cleavage/methylation domain-containing protein